MAELGAARVSERNVLTGEGSARRAGPAHASAPTTAMMTDVIIDETHSTD